MTSDLDIYRAANPLIKQYRDDAPIFAVMQPCKRVASSADGLRLLTALLAGVPTTLADAGRETSGARFMPVSATGYCRGLLMVVACLAGLVSRA